MVDRDLIIAKAAKVDEHVRRAAQKRGDDENAFRSSRDLQELVAFNIQLAVQNCIDIAAHIISDGGLGVPGSVNEMFYTLEENGYIPRDVTEQMVKAAGFRNLVAHEYGRIDLKRLFDISGSDLLDLRRYLDILFKRLGI